MFQYIETAKLNDLRSLQLKYASPEYAGHVRKCTRERIENLSQQADDEVVVRLPFGDDVISITAKRVCSHTDDEAASLAFEGVVSGVRDPDMPPGCVPTNKMLSIGKRMPAGLVLVLGAADKAKTPMVHLLASDNVDGYAVVRYGEPLSGNSVSPVQAACDLATALLTHSDIVVDSIKDLLAAAKGGAMRVTSISRGAFPILSALSTIACDLGVTIYAPINPSSDGQEVISAVAEAVKSNVATVFTATDDGWVVSARRGEGLQRENYRVRTCFSEDDLIMHFVSGKSAATGGSPGRKPVDVIAPLSDAEVNSCIRKSLSNLI